MQPYGQIVLLCNQTSSRDAAEGGGGALDPGHPRLDCFILLFDGSLILVPEQRLAGRVKRLRESQMSNTIGAYSVPVLATMPFCVSKGAEVILFFIFKLKYCTRGMKKKVNTGKRPCNSACQPTPPSLAPKHAAYFLFRHVRRGCRTSMPCIKQQNPKSKMGYLSNNHHVIVIQIRTVLGSASEIRKISHFSRPPFVSRISGWSVLRVSRFVFFYPILRVF